MHKGKKFNPTRSLFFIPVIWVVLASCDNLNDNQNKDKAMKKPKELSTYVIERKIENIGSSTALELKEGSKKSNAVIDELGPDIQWEHSYVVDNKLYCIYKATDESLIKEHARKAGVPANSISKVSTIIDPNTAE